MDYARYLLKLRRQGFYVYIQNQAVLCYCAKRELTKEDRREIEAHKVGLTEYLWADLQKKRDEKLAVFRNFGSHCDTYGAFVTVSTMYTVRTLETALQIAVADLELSGKPDATQ